jgi:hypothetical protein
MQIDGIAKFIVDRLVAKTKEISQGRNAGCFGFANNEGVVDRITKVMPGGISGLPLRKLLCEITEMDSKSIIEGLEALPANSVLIMTRPGKTGLITDVSGIDFFNIPVIAIGVKQGQMAGVGIVHPAGEYFDLATQSEEVELKILAAKNTAEEKEVLRASTELSLKYLNLSSELKIIEMSETEQVYRPSQTKEWQLPKLGVKSISGDFAEKLVAKSVEAGQGREVASIGIIDNRGNVTQQGGMVVGGIGYVPSRMLASSCVDVTGKSLRETYAKKIPENGVIVHTHPGGTGVMHIGDANAGPGSWGRPIIAIGHDQLGKVKGATVIEAVKEVYSFADEDEELGLKFFEAKTPEEESVIRNRKFGVAQEYTNLCKPIEITH